ncbi:DoxX family protein [Ekhidna sp.]|jgi:hypothetical protein|uniref:DoxX family protein n=1 Tax=Ekhidna sp. TaxID=2608089 RepID=UPI0032EF7C12
METKQLSKSRKLTSWIIAGLLTSLFLYSASGKFIAPEMTEMFEAFGLSKWITIIAIGEIISTILFLFPKTNIFGSFLLSSYMGGAIVAHMSIGDSFLVQSVVLILVWAVAFLRNPELLASFKN